MIEQNSWSQQSDNVLRYLYEDLKIFNWDLISKQLSIKLGSNVNAHACRIRYVLKYGPVQRNQWTPEQERELYRLHNENGNKWAVIALNLLGRNDNCVKNHFYSKLRKSLRTLNKITKLYFKKQAKQVSDVVLYKLTQATDQSLKQNTDFPKQMSAMCYDLKNRLLQYEMDQKDIHDGIDFSFQKQLMHGLSQFNKLYKKKSKKQKITVQGTENLKKRQDKNQRKKKNSNPKQYLEKIIYDQEDSNQLSEQPESQNQKQKINTNTRPKRNGIQVKKQEIEVQQQAQSLKYLARSQSQKSFPRKTVNYLIKAPSQQEKISFEKPLDLMSQSRKSQTSNQQHQFFFTIPFASMTPVFQIKPMNKVQDILKAEGILQNGEYGNTNKDCFIRSNSMRSFSVCSQSSHPDMFGEDVGFTVAFKQLSQMDNQSQIFPNQQNQ